MSTSPRDASTPSSTAPTKKNASPSTVLSLSAASSSSSASSITSSPPPSGSLPSPRSSTPAPRSSSSSSRSPFTAQSALSCAPTRFCAKPNTYALPNGATTKTTKRPTLIPTPRPVPDHTVFQLDLSTRVLRWRLRPPLSSFLSRPAWPSSSPLRSPRRAPSAPLSTNGPLTPTSSTRVCALIGALKTLRAFPKRPRALSPSSRYAIAPPPTSTPTNSTP